MCMRSSPLKKIRKEWQKIRKENLFYVEVKTIKCNYKDWRVQGFKNSSNETYFQSKKAPMNHCKSQNTVNA
jgi:hypothetical protein